MAQFCTKKCEDHLNNKFSSITEMCDYWNVSSHVYSERRRRGWSLEEALTGIRKEQQKENKYFDHLGNGFPTKVAMYEHWHVIKGVCENRLHKGWSLEEALTGVRATEYKCFDHLGNGYCTITEMCNHWDTTQRIYSTRIKRNWSLEEALTGIRKEQQKENKCFDHLGNGFPSKRKMCEHWNTNVTTFNCRIERNWSLGEALTGVKTVEYKYFDHLGNGYYTIKEMCNYWHINECTYKNRKDKGWSTEKCLTTKTCVMPPIRKDHIGNVFSTQNELCKYWHISDTTLHNRLQKDWTLEEALTGIRTAENKYFDHLGNGFPTIVKLCEYWHLSYSTVSGRLQSGWSVEEAITGDRKPKPKKIRIYDHLGNGFSSQKELCEYWHIDYDVFSSRYKRNWSMEDAIMIISSKKIDEKLSVIERLERDFYKVKFDKALDIWTRDEILEYEKG